MSATKMIHARVDEQTKEQASALLASMGLSVSDAVRVLLKRIIADNRLPFEVKRPSKP
jgi:DNA-damage-inducible protein J